MGVLFLDCSPFCGLFETLRRVILVLLLLHRITGGARCSIAEPADMEDEFFARSVLSYPVPRRSSLFRHRYMMPFARFPELFDCYRCLFSSYTSFCCIIVCALVNTICSRYFYYNSPTTPPTPHHAFTLPLSELYRFTTTFYLQRTLCSLYTNSVLTPCFCALCGQEHFTHGRHTLPPCTHTALAMTVPILLP